MMNLESVMTKEEQEAVQKLITTSLEIEKARVCLWDTEDKAKKAAQELTTVYYLERRDQARGVADCRIPETFVTYYGGKPYLINIDTEGDHGHRVELIGGVLGSSPNGK